MATKGIRTFWDYASLTEHAEQQITKFMELAKASESKKVYGPAEAHRQWAFGIYLYWVNLTQEQNKADMERLYALTREEP